MIKVDASEVQALTRRLRAASTNIRRDERAVVKKGAGAIVTDAVRSIRKEYTIAAKSARERIKTKLNAEDLSFSVTAAKRPFTIRNFRSVVRKGFSVVGQRKTKGPVVVFPDSFAASVRGGPLLGWQRTGARMKSNPRRQAIAPIYGPSVADMFNNKVASEDLARVGLGRMKIELERRIARALNG